MCIQGENKGNGGDRYQTHYHIGEILIHTRAKLTASVKYPDTQHRSYINFLDSYPSITNHDAELMKISCRFFKRPQIQIIIISIRNIINFLRGMTGLTGRISHRSLPPTFDHYRHCIRVNDTHVSTKNAWRCVAPLQSRRHPNRLYSSPRLRYDHPVKHTTNCLPKLTRRRHSEPDVPWRGHHGQSVYRRSAICGSA